MKTTVDDLGKYFNQSSNSHEKLGVRVNVRLAIYGVRLLKFLLHASKQWVHLLPIVESIVLKLMCNLSYRNSNLPFPFHLVELIKGN